MYDWIEVEYLNSVADPDPVPFLTLDPGSQTHIYDSLMKHFWVKSTIILSVLAKKNFLHRFKNKLFTIKRYFIFVAQKVLDKNFFFPSYSFGAVVGSRIRDGS
jgi:hypothetical protein